MLIPPYEVVHDMPSQNIVIEGVDNVETLNISQAGIDLIKGFEGLSLKAYKPVQAEQYFTIGFGHYGEDVKENQVITEAEAEDLLRKDLARFVSGVNSAVKVKLNQNQFDALVSFAYNCGLPNLDKSTLLADINRGDFASASNQFHLWVHGAGGVVLQGLVNRRQVEMNLFVKPVPSGIIAQVKVITAGLNIRQQPNPKSPILRVAKRGDVFNVTGNISDWHEVILDDKGNKGYAYGGNGQYLELVK